MKKRPLPKDLPPALEGQLLGLFERHFGVTLRTITDPQTGQAYVDIAQACEVLGLDTQEEVAQLLADPAMGQHVAIVELAATRPPPAGHPGSDRPRSRDSHNSCDPLT